MATAMCEGYQRRTFFSIICCISFSIRRAIGYLVVETPLSHAKADCMSEIPIMTDIPVRLMTLQDQKTHNRLVPGEYEGGRGSPARTSW